MSEETRKVEQTEREAIEEVKPAELSEQDLDSVSGAGYRPSVPSGPHS